MGSLGSCLWNFLPAETAALSSSKERHVEGIFNHEIYENNTQTSKISLNFGPIIKVGYLKSYNLMALSRWSTDALVSGPSVLFQPWFFHTLPSL